MRYWAFAANPLNYRIEQAVREREIDHWTTTGSPVRKGDRAIIWKTLGKSKHRGVICLAEVLGEPAERDDSSNPYWVNGLNVQHPGPLVKVRYVHSPKLPLWIEGDRPGFLHSLSVSRAHGGTVFTVTPEQWDDILNAAGGWPEEGSAYRAFSPLVLVENERTAEGRFDHWQDATGERYHFPNRYKNRMVPGRRFVYYRGERRADGKRGIPEYFGHGVLGETYLDPETDTSNSKTHWRWYCEINEYVPFTEPVPFKFDSRPIEDIPSNFWQVAVRELPEGAFREILDLAGAPPGLIATQTIRKQLNLPPIADLKISSSKNQHALITLKPQAANIPGGFFTRRSEYSKAIGDRGELIVLKHLRDSLPKETSKTVRWVANDGETPGWDIEYKENGERIGVEVKATRGSSFPSIELTANEWLAAEKLRNHYQIALVVKACSISPSVEFLDDPWGMYQSGKLSIAPLLWKIRRIHS